MMTNQQLLTELPGSNLFFAVQDAVYEEGRKRKFARVIAEGDVFHPLTCPDTGTLWEYCYWIVGECIELRDIDKRCRVVFRCKQYESESFIIVSDHHTTDEDVWETEHIIDRIDGDVGPLKAYFAVCKLADIEFEPERYAVVDLRQAC